MCAHADLIATQPTEATCHHVVITRRRLDERVVDILSTLRPNGVFWVAWPKRSSKVTTDMSDQTARQIVLPRGWVDTKVCAIDATWSGLKFVLRKELRTAPD